MSGSSVDRSKRQEEYLDRRKKSNRAGYGGLLIPESTPAACASSTKLWRRQVKFAALQSHNIDQSSDIVGASTRCDRWKKVPRAVFGLL